MTNSTFATNAVNAILLPNNFNDTNTTFVSSVNELKVNSINTKNVLVNLDSNSQYSFSSKSQFINELSNKGTEILKNNPSVDNFIVYSAANNILYCKGKSFTGFGLSYELFYDLSNNKVEYKLGNFPTFKTTDLSPVDLTTVTQKFAVFSSNMEDVKFLQDTIAETVSDYQADKALTTSSEIIAIEREELKLIKDQDVPKAYLKVLDSLENDAKTMNKEAFLNKCKEAAFQELKSIAKQFKADYSINSVQSNAQTIKQDVKDTAKKVESKVEDAADKAKSKATEVKNAVVDTAKEVKHDVKDTAKKVENKVENAADKAKSKATEVKNAVVDTAKEVKHDVKHAANKTEDKAKDLGHKIEDVAHKAKDKAVEIAHKAENKAKDFGHKVEDVAHKAKDKAVEIAHKAEDKAKDFGHRVENAAHKAKDAVVGTAQEVKQDVKDVANEVKTSVEKSNNISVLNSLDKNQVEDLKAVVTQKSQIEQAHANKAAALEYIAQQEAIINKAQTETQANATFEKAAQEEFVIVTKQKQTLSKIEHDANVKANQANNAAKVYSSIEESASKAEQEDVEKAAINHQAAEQAHNRVVVESQKAEANKKIADFAYNAQKDANSTINFDILPEGFKEGLEGTAKLAGELAGSPSMQDFQENNPLA